MYIGNKVKFQRRMPGEKIKESGLTSTLPEEK